MKSSTGQSTLTGLNLTRLQFASRTELARFVYGFSTLKECRCRQLTFVDPSPIIQSQRLRQRSSPSFGLCEVWRCDSAALATQAKFASDILMPPDHLALDGDTWDAILQALIALAPGSFDNASMMLD